MPARKTTKKAAKPRKPTEKKEFVFHTVTPEELLPDGELLCQIVIPGRAATKKTHQRVVRGGMILPSVQYVEFEKRAKPFVEAAWKNLGKQPMDFGVSVVLKVTLNNWVTGDETGYQQAIGDIIEKFGVIANDQLIHWQDDGTHMILPPDSADPKCEITIRRFRHPIENYRAQKEAEEIAKQERAKARAEKAAAKVAE